MSNITEKLRKIWKETRGNIAVELLKWLGGSSMLSAFWKAISQTYHHSPVDWALLSCLVVFGFILVVIAVLVNPKKENPVEDTTQPDDKEAISNAIKEWSNGHNTGEVLKAGVWALDSFTQLQRDALAYVKELKNFVDREMESWPEHGDLAQLSRAEVDTILDAKRVWLTRVEATYKLRFEPREDELDLRFKEKNIRVVLIHSKPGHLFIQDRLNDTAAAIVSALHEIDGIRVKVREQ